jgi:hypothetical protein
MRVRNTMFISRMRREIDKDRAARACKTARRLYFALPHLASIVQARHVTQCLLSRSCTGTLLPSTFYEYTSNRIN